MEDRPNQEQARVGKQRRRPRAQLNAASDGEQPFSDRERRREAGRVRAEARLQGLEGEQGIQGESRNEGEPVRSIPRPDRSHLQEEMDRAWRQKRNTDEPQR
jgi:hypothetical protein